jgi:8-oxo-dGTP pyrophosphatase MutT (NUDIX family)
MAHYGIYGASRQANRVVAIRKARGPYLGMLDLPGGSPERGETPMETLQRELLEECGVTQIEVLSWHDFDFFVERSSAGEPVNSYHRGEIAIVNVPEDVAPIENVEDVRGVEFINPPDHHASEFTPPFRYALTLLEESLSASEP